MERSSTSDKNKDKNISLNPLDFDEALTDLLQVKPAKNSELKKDAAKKKRKPAKK